MSGNYEIRLASLRYKVGDECRGAPDSGMEDMVAPLRSVDHRRAPRDTEPRDWRLCLSSLSS